MTINEFRTLIRTNGHPQATVLFAVNETTGESIGNTAWDNPQPLPFDAPQAHRSDAETYCHLTPIRALSVPVSKSQYANWYADRKWRKKRDAQLHREPLCRYCARLGLVTVADVADHIEPHNGDRQKFWCGELQSLCHHCHSSVKQREDNGTPVKHIGVDGWPVEPIQ